MKPTTTLTIIIAVTVALMLFCCTLVTMESIAMRYDAQDTIRQQNKRILDLEHRIIQLSTMNEVMHVFDMILPENYRAELAQIDYQLRYGGRE